MAEKLQDELNERAQQLLKVLVEQYIADGQPVGSRTLARAAGLDLSPATVRNVMADLEDLGLVCSPHTSAGRVPTSLGYRLFIDNLLQPQPLGERERRQIRKQLEAQRNAEQSVAEYASDLLSQLTSLVSVVTVPRRDYATLRQIEFLPLSDRRVLVILVVNDREVQNRIIQVSRDHSESELREASNYINALFAGRDLHTIREVLVRDLMHTQDSMDEMMQESINLAASALGTGELDEKDCVVTGQTNLMSVNEFASIDVLRNLFDTFNRKRDLLSLFDMCLDADGVQIFVGDESGYQVLDECSVVTSPYRVDGEVVGVLGVIGPTRMAYDRVIPIVEATARMLGSALKSGN